MEPFITAAQLKKKYIAYGHFYCLKFSEKIVYPCRSVLDIILREAELPIDEPYIKRKPNAVFIMMNPGSSAPIETKSCDIRSNESLNDFKWTLVEAKPDITQYQVMRIMDKKEWCHIRVINLSDIREPNSDKLFKIIKDLDSNCHSIFSKEREFELIEKCDRDIDAPIIGAWGISNSLAPLKELCTKSTLGNIIIGYKEKGSKDKYYHPLPKSADKQKAWVTELVKIVG